VAVGVPRSPVPEPVPVEKAAPATPSVPLLGAWHRHEERKGRSRRIVNGLAFVAIAAVILALGYGALRGFRGGASSRKAAVRPDTLRAESRVSPPAAGDSERALPGMVVPQAEPGDEEEAIPEEAGDAPSSGGFGDLSPGAGAEEAERAGNPERRAPSDAAASVAEPVVDPTRAAAELAARRAARRDSLRLLRLLSREDSMRVALRSQVASDSFTASQSPAGSRNTDALGLTAAPAADSLASARPSLLPSGASPDTPPAAQGTTAETPAGAPRPASDTTGLAPSERRGEPPEEHPAAEPLSAFLPARVDTFVVHLSSFRLLNEAETEVARFRSLGVDARYLRVPVEGMGTWYRVITGRFATFAQAESLALRLEAAGTISHAHLIGKGGWGDPVPVTPGGAREQGAPGK
jgi:hypothetical protein